MGVGTFRRDGRVGVAGWTVGVKAFALSIIERGGGILMPLCF